MDVLEASPEATTVRETLLEAELRGEIGTNRIRLALASLFGLMLLTAGGANTPAANRIMELTVAPWVVYAVWHHLYTRRLEGHHGRWLPYLSCTVDLVVVAAGYLAAAENHTGIMEYWRSQTLIVFAFWNLLSGLRLNPTLSLYSAALTAALNSTLLAHTLRYGGIEVRLESVYSMSAINVADQIVTIIFISMPGLVAAVIAARARTLIVRAESESLMRAQVERHRDRLGRYLPRILVDLLLRQVGESRLDGERRYATIVFTDIRNFTPLAEQHHPEALVEFLNSYFSQMVDVIVRYAGSVDKFMGDGLMATFGVPRELAHSETRAVLAAVEMHHSLERMREDFADRGFDDIQIGVGIASGPVVCGNIGSHTRMEFTCIGDTVNLAARLERGTRDLGEGLLVSEKTAEGLDARIPLVELEAQPIRGKREPVRVFSLDPHCVEPELLTSILADLEGDEPHASS